MKVFFIVLIIVVFVLLAGAVLGIANNMYMPEEGDVVRTKDNRMWKILGPGQEPKTVVANQIDPETFEFLWDHKPEIFSTDDIEVIVTLSERRFLQRFFSDDY